MKRIALAVMLCMASPALAQLPEAPAPRAVESVTENLDPYTYAKRLTSSGDYEGSLIILAGINPLKIEKALYNEYCFHMAVNHFALNNKADAEKWIKNLNDTFEPLLRRHAALVYLMEEDIKHWKEGDLSDIERDMRKSADRLNNAKGGEGTQKVQKEIVAKLDKLIKEQEDKNNAAAAAANAPKGPDGKPLPPQQGPGDKNSTQPAPDSTVMGGKGDGKVDEKQLRKIAENWGTMPPAARAKVVQDLTRDLPPKYEPMIKNYFEALNRMHPNK